ncbi:MBOAT family O-acyltransferase [uncultured Thiodictyon sp.]|jgi:D-alanyl-lipoteichoic acid acyltransferase DltB (MBOAT superfamily)|uniref:MBOAT family O-acyltransferase n=1 Tax=uncultured Thiodictyon sp. TaxID=1846217 RepID=UPI0025F535D1|nr:MBOAT family O-acyltransferase [uncultured Thiodictyon sp.]
MLFTSLPFLIFFVVCYLIYWRIGTRVARQWFLVAASLFFYGWWDFRFVALMLFVAVVAYLGALGISRCRNQERRRLILITSLIAHLGVLFFFKYFNFFMDSLQGVAALLGSAAQLPAWHVILPVGISFYTFHAISYTVDVYRAVVRPDYSFREVLLYIAFFPQLVAGPIIRSSFFMPQLRSDRQRCDERLAAGLRLFLIGFFYKAVIADTLAVIADQVFADPQRWSTLGLWGGALAYYGQIYFDFNGYTTMAIGIAWFFGYRLPDNFNFPYSARNIADFWHRWHMSLSTWLRDYLYVPLGGNRYGIRLQYRNLMLTMLLGGLWHGASWNFVIWGGLHGLALIVHKQWIMWTGERKGTAWGLVPSLLLTQLWVLVAWVFFRSQSLDDSLTMLRGMAGIGVGSGQETMPPWVLPAIVLPVIADAVLGRLQAAAPGSWELRLGWPAYAGFTGIAAALFLWLVPLTSAPFIYFQF